MAGSYAAFSLLRLAAFFRLLEDWFFLGFLVELLGSLTGDSFLSGLFSLLPFGRFTTFDSLATGASLTATFGLKDLDS